MQAEQLYRIRFDEAQTSGRGNRVGLLHSRTGSPAFLLFLESLASPVEFQCQSLESLELFASGFHSSDDRQAILELRLFFEEGGKSTTILGSPLKADADLLGQMIGLSRNIKSRSGLQLFRNVFEIADLLAVPQARRLLSPESNQRFTEELLSITTESNACFALVEVPQLLNVEESIQWAKVFTCPDAALYYPALISRNTEGKIVEFSVLPAIAAHYQSTDRDANLGISELPTSHAFHGRAEPSVRLSPSQQMELLAARMNSIVFAPGPEKSVRVWGGYTLARPPHLEFSLIPVRRTLRALREALENIAESFVLEPLSAGMEDTIADEIKVFLDENEELLDLFKKPAYSVQVKLLKGRDADGIEINCRFKLSRCVQELKMSFGVSQ